MTSVKYKPFMSQKEIERRQQWQEEVYKNLKSVTGERIVKVLDKKVIVLPGIFAPLWGDSLLLAKVINAEMKNGDKVLDLGTGAGVQGIFAAPKASSVLSVDINPKAIRCAKMNALKNRYGDKIRVLKSDLFSNVKGKYDLVIYNPPFRWFKPRDMIERGELDEGYKILRKFFKQVKRFLTEKGRVLIVFSDSGDLKYFNQLIKQNNYKKKILAKDKLNNWHYFVYKLTTDSKGFKI